MSDARRGSVAVGVDAASHSWLAADWVASENGDDQYVRQSAGGPVEARIGGTVVAGDQVRGELTVRLGCAGAQ
ncbi:hypothetical protein ACFYZH_19780 [Streptomyces abikoensis]|uniref:hypothetical protein n=1 Tax=Streptomyces abikoensis TaxID=97398 RepID=UPI0036C5C2CC